MLLGKLSQGELDRLTGRSLQAQTSWCGEITPALPEVTIQPRCVLIDGTYIGS